MTWETPLFFLIVKHDVLANRYEMASKIEDDIGAQRALEAAKASTVNGMRIYTLSAPSAQGIDEQWRLLLAEGPTAPGLRLTCEGFDLKREEMEMGPGGDADVPYKFYGIPFPLNAQKLAVLAARFQRGEVGGAADGEPEPPKTVTVTERRRLLDELSQESQKLGLD